MPAPHRIVTLLASGTEIVCALDGAGRLVGRSHECDHPPDVVSRLPALTETRTDPSAPSGAIHSNVRELLSHTLSVYIVHADRLAALEPDLLVTQVQCEVCAVSLRDVEAAVRQGLPSHPNVVSLQPNTLADIWADMRRVASAMGVPERGVQLVTRLRARMRAIAERTRGRERPRVACLDWIDPLLAAGHWMPELIGMAGADDALGRAGAPGGELTLSALAAAEPDVVWVVPCGFDLRRTRAEMAALEAQPAWRELRAVREGRVFLGDGNALFHRPGPRLAETLECLAEAMHPGAFRFGHEGSGWARYAPQPAVNG